MKKKGKVTNPNSDFAKINACITDRQFRYIEEERKKVGITFSDMLRRALDDYLDSYLKIK